MKVMFVGDVHAQFDNLKLLVNFTDCDIVIQCGDFGIWTDCVSELPDYYYRDFNKPVYFVEGNHDNHKFLSTVLKKEPNWQNGIKFYDNLIWMPRGSRMNFNEKSFFFCGGADSIDKEYRLTYYPDTWWPEEKIDDAILNSVNNDEEFDFVIAHDRPTFVTYKINESMLGRFNKIGNSSDVLEKLYSKIKVHHWINGHWHERKEMNFFDTEFITLDMLPMNYLIEENCKDAPYFIIKEI